MRGDDHAVAQAALAQGSLEIRDSLVSVCGILGGSSDGRRCFTARGLILSHTHVRSLQSAVDCFWNVSSGRVHDHLSLLKNCHKRSY